MRLTVNGTDTELADATTVGQLVDGLGQGRAGMAVARNDEVVPRSRWDVTPLDPGDRVELLTVAQGG